MATTLIRRFFEKITNFSKFKLKSYKNQLKANIVPRAQHEISRSSFSKNVIKVLYRLKNNGFEAYIVGGFIRDMLLDIEPKDCDIVTNAKPQQVRAIFKNCRLIGRRFPLAHVYFKNETIEVATFRANTEPKGKATANKQNSDNNMILRDNIYSNNIADDVLRRDFTINALYYNIKDFTLVDFVGGIEDINNKVLRIIGEPNLRYEEDPVRMLRVVRFAAKLELNIHSDTAKPIFTKYKLLEQVSSARLLEEYKKLFLSGYSYNTYKLLLEYNLINVLFPSTNISETNQYLANLIIEVLKNTDQRVAAGKTLAPGFLLAAFLWQALHNHAKQLLTKKTPLFVAYTSAMDLIIAKQNKVIAFSRAITTFTKDVWMLQLRLKKRAGKSASRVFRHPKFRAGYDFLVLRAKSGEPQAIELEVWWNKYMHANEKERWKMAKMLNKSRKTN